MGLPYEMVEKEDYFPKTVATERLRQLYGYTRESLSYVTNTIKLKKRIKWKSSPYRLLEPGLFSLYD
jgi:hypothetical protein